MASGSRANIVLILTDDQDIVLNEALGAPLGPMSQTKALLQDGGAFGIHAYVAVPICCPSRANILSGRYAHNLRDATYEPFPQGASGGSCGDEPVEDLPQNGALPCGCMRMNISSFGTFESETFASRLQTSGYRTAYFGKYLNPPAMVKYCRDETIGPLEHGWPQGWDTFYGMCDQASTPAGGYYDVNWVDSVANATTFTGASPDEYTTSVIGNKTSEWITQHASDPSMSATPFMVVAATRAPHAPYLPPPWYADKFSEITSPRSVGSYNHSTENKAPWMATNLPLDASDATHFDEIMRRRWGALLAVDDLVAGVMSALEKASYLNSTYVCYWSDHGYHLGSFRLQEGKMHFYEFDIRVPFMLRGPGIPAGLTLDHVVGNIDLAPTFLDIAGVATNGLSPPIDGHSMLPLVILESPTAAAAAASEKQQQQIGAGAAAPCCNGHGTCLPPLPSQCFCNRGYIGAQCTACGAGYTGYPNCVEVPWRDRILIEYYPIQNFQTPAKIAAHDRINDGPNNTFRALRVVNATHDFVFAEITTLEDWNFDRVQWRELYDMRADPFQLYNLYANTGGGALSLGSNSSSSVSATARGMSSAQLHAELLALWQCVGSECP